MSAFPNPLGGYQGPVTPSLPGVPDVWDDSNSTFSNVANLGFGVFQNALAYNEVQNAITSHTSANLPGGQTVGGAATAGAASSGGLLSSLGISSTMMLVIVGIILLVVLMRR